MLPPKRRRVNHDHPQPHWTDLADCQLCHWVYGGGAGMSGDWTPGPWKAEIGTSGRSWHVAAPSTPIAEVWLTGDNHRANANLLAAAPDLHDALSRVMQWIEGWDPNFIFDDDWSNDETFIKAALAKARGEQP